MPVHDWTRVDAGLFHAFHQVWVVEISRALNRGGLPAGFYALPEQAIPRSVPDVLTVRVSGDEGGLTGPGPAVAVAEVPPRARLVRIAEGEVYARRADRVSVRHRHGEVVATIEIVSPGNKSSVRELQAFVEKVSRLIRQGVHVLVVDLLPPTRRDPAGIHKAIWDVFTEEDFDLSIDRPLTLASYAAGTAETAYVESVGVGEVLIEMPLFLTSDVYVPVPLEATYMTTWGDIPPPFKVILETS